jgi:hypothetical protein
VTAASLGETRMLRPPSVERANSGGGLRMRSIRVMCSWPTRPVSLEVTRFVRGSHSGKHSGQVGRRMRPLLYH